MLLCLQRKLPAVIVEIDTKALVDAFNNPSYKNSVISIIFDDCKHLILQIPQVCIKHVYREANKCVDWLANSGHSQSVDFILHLFHLWAWFPLLRLIVLVFGVTGSALSFPFLVSWIIFPVYQKKKKNLTSMDTFFVLVQLFTEMLWTSELVCDLRTFCLLQRLSYQIEHKWKVFCAWRLFSVLWSNNINIRGWQMS